MSNSIYIRKLESMQNLSQISEGWIHSKTDPFQYEIYINDFPLIKKNFLCYRSTMAVERTSCFFVFFSWWIRFFLCLPNNATIVLGLQIFINNIILQLAWLQNNLCQVLQLSNPVAWQKQMCCSSPMRPCPSVVMLGMHSQ